MPDQSNLLDTDKSLEETSSQGCQIFALVTLLVLCSIAIILFTIIFVESPGIKNKSELFYIDKQAGIYKVSNLHGTYTVDKVLGDVGVIGVDVDCRNEMLYWTNINDKTIKRGHLTEDGIIQNPTNLVNRGLQFPSDVVVDTVNNNLYWSDTGGQQIGVFNMDDGTTNLALIPDMKNRNPLAITVDQETGHIYWAYAVGGGSEFGVMNSTLDGTASLMTVTDMPVTGLQYDDEMNSVCWCDMVSTIECINLDDSSRYVITNEGKQPFDVAFTEDKIYWTSVELNDILYIPRNSKGTAADIQSLNINATEIQGITAGKRC